MRRKKKLLVIATAQFVISLEKNSGNENSPRRFAAKKRMPDRVLFGFTRMNLVWDRLLSYINLFLSKSIGFLATSVPNGLPMILYSAHCIDHWKNQIINSLPIFYTDILTRNVFYSFTVQLKNAQINFSSHNFSAEQNSFCRSVRENEIFSSSFSYIVQKNNHFIL